MNNFRGSSIMSELFEGVFHILQKYPLKMFIRYWNTPSKSSDVIELPLKLFIPYWTMVQMLLTMVQMLLNLVQILLNISYCSKNYTKFCHILLSMSQTLLTSTQTFLTHPLKYSYFVEHPPESLIFYLT